MTDDQSMIIVHAAPYARKERKSALRGEQNKKSAQGEIKKNALRRKGTLSAWRKRGKDESTSFI